jgi:hypothetical protein
MYEVRTRLFWRRKAKSKRRKNKSLRAFVRQASEIGWVPDDDDEDGPPNIAMVIITELLTLLGLVTPRIATNGWTTNCPEYEVLCTVHGIYIYRHECPLE